MFIGANGVNHVLISFGYPHYCTGELAHGYEIFCEIGFFNNPWFVFNAQNRNAKSNQQRGSEYPEEYKSQA